MKRLFKFMLLFSMLVITSISVNASVHHENSSPLECSFIAPQNFDITIDQIAFFTPVNADVFIYKDIQSDQIQKCNFIALQTNKTKIKLFRSVLFSKKLHINLIPLPVIIYLDTNNINHYSKGANAQNKQNIIPV